jgi:hypothetical protein
MKRGRKLAPWLAGFGCAAAWIGLIYLLVIAYSPPSGVRAEQGRIVTAIQAFREQHDRLPDSLQEAGIEFDNALFDSVDYSKLTANPLEFTISCTKQHTFPTPGIHWWYYQSEQGSWEYEHESI